MNLVNMLGRFDGFIVGQAGSVVLTAITFVILIGLLVRQNAKKQLFVPNLCDFGVLTFCVMQIVSAYCGLYRENALIYGVGVATAANIYFIFRIEGGLNSKPFRLLAIVACFLGLSLALVDIPMTIVRFTQWKRLQLSDIVAFRAYFYLTGVGTKIDALSLALALLPFSLFVLICERRTELRVLAVLSFIGSSTVIAMGMSRGVYFGAIFLCLSIFTVAWLRKIKLNREIIRILLMLGMVMIITISAYTVSVKHAGNVGSGTSTSETRSVDGRLHIWSGTLAHIQSYKLFGVGSDNGVLYTLEYIQAVPYETFTARTYNWLLEILLQNGILGLFSFSAIVAGVLISPRRIINSTEGNPQSRQLAIVAQSTLIAILASDLTNSSIICYPPVMCTFFALAGALNEDESKSAVGAKHQQSKWNMTTSYGFVVLLMLTVIYLIASGIRRTHSESEYATASLATRQGDYEGALQHIAVAEYNSDCDALYASMEGFNYQRSVDEGQQFNDLWHRNIILTHRRREGLEKAASAYQRASACAPMDAGIHHTLGWLYTMLGDDRQAREQVNESLRLEPNTALYHLSSGLLNERKGNTNAAYAEYSEAIALSPRILDSDFFIQLKLRHPDKISDIIDRSKNVVEQFANTPMRQAALAKLYYQVNDYTSAKSALHNALMELPTLSNAWVTQGKIDEDEGDIYKAVMDYRRALFVDSINRVAWAGLAEVYEVTDNNQKGLHAARMAVMSEEPSEHSLRSSRMYHMNTISSDDLIPFGILDYARPRIDIDHLYKIINEMTERGGVEVP